jgi:hypothetical protein
MNKKDKANFDKFIKLAFGLSSNAGFVKDLFDPKNLLALFAVSALTKIGVNKKLSEYQNKGVDIAQSYLDLFHTEEKFASYIDVVGKGLGVSDKQLENFKESYLKYTQPKGYKMDVGDIEILEISSYNAFKQYSKTGSKMAGALYFFKTAIPLIIRKNQSERNGKEFHVANNLGQLFGIGGNVKEIMLPGKDSQNPGDDPFNQDLIERFQQFVDSPEEALINFAKEKLDAHEFNNVFDETDIDEVLKNESNTLDSEYINDFADNKKIKDQLDQFKTKPYDPSMSEYADFDSYINSF